MRSIPSSVTRDVARNHHLVRPALAATAATTIAAAPTRRGVRHDAADDNLSHRPAHLVIGIGWRCNDSQAGEDEEQRAQERLQSVHGLQVLDVSVEIVETPQRFS
jgi:hypothetical protein